MGPQQELFTTIMTTLLSCLPCRVYDGALPPSGVSYPFVYMGETMQSDIQNKSCVGGTVIQTIHVWSDKPTMRGELSGIIDQITMWIRRLPKRTFSFELKKLNTRILYDDVENQGKGGAVLMHGIINCTFEFSPVDGEQ